MDGRGDVKTAWAGARAKDAGMAFFLLQMGSLAFVSVATANSALNFMRSTGGCCAVLSLAPDLVLVEKHNWCCAASRPQRLFFLL